MDALDVLSEDAWLSLAASITDAESLSTLVFATCKTLRIVYGADGDRSDHHKTRQVLALNAHRRILGMLDSIDVRHATGEDRRGLLKSLYLAKKVRRLSRLVQRGINGPRKRRHSRNAAGLVYDRGNSIWLRRPRWTAKDVAVPIPVASQQTEHEYRRQVDRWFLTTIREPPIDRCLSVWVAAALLGMDNDCASMWTARDWMERSQHGAARWTLPRLMGRLKMGDVHGRAHALQRIGFLSRSLWQECTRKDTPWTNFLGRSLQRNMTRLVLSDNDHCLDFMPERSLMDMVWLRRGAAAFNVLRGSFGAWPVNEDMAVQIYMGYRETKWLCNMDESESRWATAASYLLHGVDTSDMDGRWVQALACLNMYEMEQFVSTIVKDQGLH
ncbi:hypothetical protein ml_364 [Mollivirus sibericum]|uniref:hypothetical protein n=1 Tax=Mollivirus sibericum TaxID=1678078 RepID=UPI0006B2E9A0|nr:hypothetical protein ml_364 [Mollivirus sibericum]ALD62166.1 hypothetical protein ml_364 [Mollivirus sibericum]